jgi:predicted CoA-binding protein
MSDFNHDSYNDDYIRAILQESKTIAMVGASARTSRPSYFVLKYLLQKGFKVIPVNPREAGTEILGQETYATLADVPVNIDMVDIFRNSQAADAITDEAIAINAKIVWMQLSVRNDEAAHRAQAAGLKVVMNRCPKIEYGRLSGEIGWMGVNSRKLSSKKPILSGNRVQSFRLSRPKT